MGPLLGTLSHEASKAHRRRLNRRLSLIKVITLTGLILMGVVLDLGGNPQHDRIGERVVRSTLRRNG